MWNGGVLQLKEGQCLVGRKRISLETNIPESTVERALNWLEKEGQIEQQTNNKFRVITVLNWREYQGEGQQTDSQRTTNGQPADTYKNDKKVKNEKKQGIGPPNGVPVFNPLGAEIIKAFEEVDPKNKRYYGNTTQRGACDFLLGEYGLEEVVKRVKVLPRTNKAPFFPSIMTPVQLRDKWVQLQDAVDRKRGEIEVKKVKII